MTGFQGRGKEGRGAAANGHGVSLGDDGKLPEPAVAQSCEYTENRVFRTRPSEMQERALSLSLSLSACPVSTATVASLGPALTPELTPRPSDSPRCPLCAPRGTQGAPFKMQVTLCPSPAKAPPIAPRIEFNPPVAHGDLCDLPPALPDLIPSHAPSSRWPSVCSSSPQACPLFGAFPGCAPLTRGSAPTSPPQRGPLPGQPGRPRPVPPLPGPHGPVCVCAACEHARVCVCAACEHVPCPSPPPNTAP